MLSFALDGEDTDFITAFNSNYFNLSIPEDYNIYKVYEASAVAYMKEYPDVTSNPILFSVTVLVPSVPIIPDLEFTVGESIV